MPRRSSRELAVQAEIQRAHSQGTARLFRNNVGALPDQNGRPVAYGLGSSGSRVNKGTSDLIGWKTIEITPEMVGRHVAVFTAIEVKDLGKPTPEQQAFIRQVVEAGGIAGVAHSPEEAAALLRFATDPS